MKLRGLDRTSQLMWLQLPVLKCVSRREIRELCGR